MTVLRFYRRALIVVTVGAAIGLGTPVISVAGAAVPVQQTAATAQPASSRIAPPAGGFQAVDARRIMDTRSGLGAAGPVPANATRSIKVAGAGGLPASGIAGVAITITVPAAAQSGTVTAYARGAARPTAPSVTFSAGRGVSTLALVPVDAAGYVTLANNSSGPIQLVVDTAGYTAAGGAAGPGGWVPLAPTRVVETATKLGSTGPVPARSALTPRLTGKAGIPSTGVLAVTLVVTVVNPTQAGYLTARPEGQVPAGSAPTGSNINFTPGQSAGNLVIVPVSASGGVQLYNNSFAPVGITVDVTGYLTAGTPAEGSLVPVPMARMVDTRSRLGVPPSAPAGPLGARSVTRIDTLGKAGLPAGGASALLLSVTVTQPTVAGVLRIHRDIADGSSTSNLNVSVGKNSTNLVLVPIGPNGAIHLTNSTTGTMHVIIDVVGYVRAGVAAEPAMTWSAPAPAGLDSADLLDCTSSTFCLAMDDAGPSATYNGTAWTSVTGGPTDFVTGLSCPTATFCVAVTYAGTAAVFDGAAWKTPVSVAPGRALVGVSCATAGFCLAISDVGTAYRWNGSSWAGAAAVADVPDEYSPSPQTISCASTTFCVAAGTWGGGWTFNGTAWNADAIGLQDGLRSSCPVAGFCTVMDSSSQGGTLSGGAWTVNSLSWSAYLSGLSCADASFCAAVGGDQVTIWDGVNWTDPAAPITLPDTAAVISCPTRQFCMTLGYPGHQIIGTR